MEVMKALGGESAHIVGWWAAVEQEDEVMLQEHTSSVEHAPRV